MTRPAWFLTALLLPAATVWSQECSNSLGGAFRPKESLVIDTDTGMLTPPGKVSPGFDGRSFHFTRIRISEGVSVVGAGRQPLVLLATGDVTIAGTVDVSGSVGGPGVGNTSAGGRGGAGGPGGFAGGAGGGTGRRTHDGAAGAGPGGGGGGEQREHESRRDETSGGGGAGHRVAGQGGATAKQATPGAGGRAYESATELRGGSGGGGGSTDNDGPLDHEPAAPDDGGGGGGGGGGVLRIVSGGAIELTATATLDASGGSGGGVAGSDDDGGGGGGGSGGLVQLFAGTTLSVNGRIDIEGGPGGASHFAVGGAGAAGRSKMAVQPCGGQRPACRLAGPRGKQADKVRFTLELLGESEGELAIAIELSCDGGATWSLATAASSSRLPNPASARSPAKLEFAWDARADGIGTEDQVFDVRLRARVSAPGVESPGQCVTPPFDVGKRKPRNVAWSLSGSDLATWTVRNGDSPRDPWFSLCLFGYQIERGGQANFPVHRLAELTYDLALKTPLGRVRQGAKEQLAIRYESIANHAPFEVLIRGEITELTSEHVRFEATVHAGKRLAKGKFVVRALSGLVVTVFDLKSGTMKTSDVQITCDVIEAASEDASPKRHTFHHRFELDRIREYHPTRLDAPVSRTIEKGTVWLRAQIEDGGGYPGWNAFQSEEIVALALLVCGAEREDPVILRLMDRVRSKPLRNTYEIGVALMAMEALHSPADEVSEVHAGRRELPARRDLPPGDREWMQARVAWLLDLAARSSNGIGWGYHAETSRPDISASSYAILGLLSAHRCGLEVPDEIWAGAAQFALSLRTEGFKTLLSVQRVTDRHDRTVSPRRVEARGFQYTPNYGRAYGSMTANGIAILRVCRDVLRRKNSRVLRSGLAIKIDRGIEGGWAWLSANWLLQRQEPSRHFFRHCYYLYGIERAAVLCGLRKISGRDWYAEGAALLIETQNDAGYWESPTFSRVLQTSLALLYLKRGTLPVITGEY